MSGKNTIHDPFLGEVVFSSSSSNCDEYSANFAIGDSAIEITLESDESLDILPAIETAKRVLQDWDNVIGRVRVYLEEAVLPEISQAWEQANMTTLNAEELFSSLSQPSLVIESTGECGLWFNGDKPLLYHVLQLDLDGSLNIVDHGMAG